MYIGICLGIQEVSKRDLSRLEPRSGQLPASAGAAKVGAALVAVDVAREVDQDRGKGGGALPVRVLSDDGSRCAQATVPGDPGADSTGANARAGATMTAAHDEMAGGRRRDGTDLSVPGPNARMKRVLGRITVGSQADACLVASRKSLPMPENAVTSLKRPTVAVGATSSGKYRSMY